MAVPMPKRRFTTVEYHRMAEAGILRPDDRVELIEGEVVEKVEIGARHAGCVSDLDRQLQRLLGARAHVRVQSPLRLSDLSEPQPDLCLVRPRPDDYRGAHPEPGDTLLVVEVADTSAQVDRQVKGPLYARAGVPEYWLVDLTAGLVEVFREGRPEGWAVRRVVRPGDRLSPAAFPDAELDVDAVLA